MLLKHGEGIAVIVVQKRQKQLIQARILDLLSGILKYIMHECHLDHIFESVFLGKRRRFIAIAFGEDRTPRIESPILFERQIQEVVRAEESRVC